MCHLKNYRRTWVNDFKGYFYMSEEYFKLKTVVVMVNKTAFPEKVKEKLEIT